MKRVLTIVSCGVLVACEAMVGPSDAGAAGGAAGGAVLVAGGAAAGGLAGGGAAAGGSSGGTGGGAAGGSAGGSSGGSAGGAATLSGRYPGDVGIGAAPSVLWHETFEAATPQAVGMRYDSSRVSQLTLVPDRPAGSPGQRSGRFAAGAGGDTSDLFKRFPAEADELFVRYYVKYETAPYHHTGVWMGGYNPPTAWPNPMAGVRPNGSDRISVGFEPASDTPMGRRLDFYNVWFGMRSWQGFSYGNWLVNRSSVRTRPGTWQCIEYQVKLNDDPTSSRGGELAVWIDDSLIYRYDANGPRGYWVAATFCPSDADSPNCLDFAPAPAQRTSSVVDLRWRTNPALRLNWLWLLNYTSSDSSAVQFDDVVVARERIGCRQ